MGREMTDAERAAWRRLVEAARRFVRCADEFPEDPSAVDEVYVDLEGAQTALARAWDGEPAPAVSLEVARLRDALELAHHHLSTLHGLCVVDAAAPTASWSVDLAHPLEVIDRALGRGA